MFRLIRLLVSLIGLMVFIWFAVKVPIGQYTLYQHVCRIWRTPEVQELKESSKQTVKDVAHDIRQEIRTPAAPSHKSK